MAEETVTLWLQNATDCDYGWFFGPDGVARPGIPREFMIERDEELYFISDSSSHKTENAWDAFSSSRASMDLAVNSPYLKAQCSASMKSEAKTSGKCLYRSITWNAQDSIVRRDVKPSLTSEHLESRITPRTYVVTGKVRGAAAVGTIMAKDTSGKVKLEKALESAVKSPWLPCGKLAADASSTTSSSDTHVTFECFLWTQGVPGVGPVTSPADWNTTLKYLNEARTSQGASPSKAIVALRLEPVQNISQLVNLMVEDSTRKVAVDYLCDVVTYNVAMQALEQYISEVVEPPEFYALADDPDVIAYHQWLLQEIQTIKTDYSRLARYLAACTAIDKKPHDDEQEQDAESFHPPRGETDEPEDEPGLPQEDSVPVPEPEDEPQLPDDLTERASQKDEMDGAKGTYEKHTLRGKSWSRASEKSKKAYYAVERAKLIWKHMPEDESAAQKEVEEMNAKMESMKTRRKRASKSKSKPRDSDAEELAKETAYDQRRRYLLADHPNASSESPPTSAPTDASTSSTARQHKPGDREPPQAKPLLLCRSLPECCAIL